MEWIKVTEETIFPIDKKFLVIVNNNVFIVSYITKPNALKNEKGLFDYYLNIPEMPEINEDK